MQERTKDGQKEFNGNPTSAHILKKGEMMLKNKLERKMV